MRTPAPTSQQNIIHPATTLSPSLPLFLVTSFGVTWVLWLPLVFRLPLPPWWFYLGAVGPAAGAIATLVQRGGWQVLATWVRSRLGTPGKARTWVLALGGLVIATTVTLVAEMMLTGSHATLDGLGTSAELPGWPPLGVGLLLLASYGFCEELGWRGVLLPVLVHRWGPRRAAVAVGMVWCLWHLPAFFCNPTYQAMGWGVFGWALSLVAGSVVFAWIAGSSAGSLWTVVVWHGLFDFLMVSDSSAAFLAPVLSMAVLGVAPFAWIRLTSFAPSRWEQP